MSENEVAEPEAIVVVEEKKIWDLVAGDDGSFKASLDLDGDGDPIVEVEVYSKEALQEILDKGVAKEGVKIVEVDSSLSSIVLLIDSDKDGEPSMKVTVSLKEALGLIF